jgi:oxygen-independent coproporphyrinogen-3 oxidase
VTPRRTIPIIPASGDALPEHSVRLAALPPLSVYVHFPWCVRKCPYCDFNSHEMRGELPEAEYVAALIADLEQSLPAIWGRPVSSVFIGGGTPSLLSPHAVDALLSAVRARLPLLPDAEITIEANPGATDAGNLAGYRAAGVNRISLGIQSFDDCRLAALGRIHDADEARHAIGAAQRHFENVNLDMMFALPGQTLEEARADIRRAASFGTPHLSAYQLTLEPNTPFFHAPPPLPDSDLAAAMQDAVEETLAGEGYTRYEVSAFAHPGRECRHNLNYWQFGDYLGIGAGAHGKLSFAERITRQARPRQPNDYLAATIQGALQEAREVAASDLPFEFMLNALRLSGGVPARLFVERTGLPLSAMAMQLAEAERRGLLAVTAERIVPTQLGRHFLNDLLQVFLTE